MNDEALAKVMADLEERIGPDNMSKLRRAATNKGVSVLTLLGDAVRQYLPKIKGKDAA